MTYFEDYLPSPDNLSALALAKAEEIGKNNHFWTGAD